MKYFFDNEADTARLLIKAGNWLGTPFFPHGKVIGAGVDCVHLVAETYMSCGVIAEFDPPKYSMDGGSHNSTSQVIDYVDGTGRFEKIPQSAIDDFRLPGDLICFRLGRVEHHTGIVLTDKIFIHAKPGDGVIASRLDDSTYSSRVTALYRPLAHT